MELDSIIVQAVIRIKDENGNPLGEQLSQPVKLFKASVPDVWAALEKDLAKDSE